MRLLLVLLLASLSGTLPGQPASVLSSGKWHKLSVTADGVYKLDYTFLKNIGFNPDGLDPRKLQLFAGEHGMLPQANATPRAIDLQQLAIHAVGFDDGKFDGSDYLLFYAQGPDSYQLLPSKSTFRYENNIFSDKNFYYLTLGTTNGLRMSLLPDTAGTFPIVTEFDDFGYYETDQSNELHSGRTWYGERFDATLEYTIRFDLSNVIDASTIKLVTGVMARSFSPSSFTFSINNVTVDEQTVPVVLDERYAIIGADVHDTVSVNAATVSASTRTNQDVKVRFTKATSGTSIGFLDYILLHVKRTLSLYGDQKIFSSLKSLDQPISRYTITQCPSDGLVWDITDPVHPSVQATSFISPALSFAAPSGDLRKYIVLSNRNYPSPAPEGDVPNQNVRGIGATDLLIVTAPDFITEAERLASHRRSKNGLNVSVVTTTQVYNEFSGGKQDVTALRDLVKHLYDKGTGIKNVLLFGRGSYDYKDKLSFNKNFVPIYQSRNSLNPLETYASDDYIGFVETLEGNWGESPPEAHTLDVGIGRVPVKKVEEAAAWVDKVIAYENQNWGSWRKRILFAADDGDFNTHQSQANQMANTLEKDQPEVDVRKMYLDFYSQATSQAEQPATEARKALTTHVNDGIGILNFTGHGSELQWMQERVLDQTSFDEWKPSPRYPFLVTATCEFGRNDDPGLISSAELSLFKTNSGSIGLVTTSRPVYSSTNFTLNKAFYQSLFTRSNGLFQDWGTIFRNTKNSSISGVSNRNFSLLGDPSMLPPLGSSELMITDILNLTSGSDTLKALSKVRVTGAIYHQGLPDSQFEGKLVLTMYDKLSTLTTKGDENPPFSFTLRDNALFRGQASVHSGVFEIEFVVPMAIDPTVGFGKLSAYAFSKTANRDAMGAQDSVKIGAAEADPGTDATGPDIELFMGDTTFISGGLAGSNSRIVAILSDNNGIDISSFNSANDILAILDDTDTLTLNDYYQADVDTYTRGKVDYPVYDLKPGFHTLTLWATDTFGNSSSASITFYVSDQSGIQIEQWLNYPNPFSSSTVFHFKHNRSGEDLEAAVTIFDRMGKVVLYNTYQIGSSSYKVDLPPWDGTSVDGNKLAEGLYLMKLSVRSLLDGTKNERIAKVILLN